MTRSAACRLASQGALVLLLVGACSDGDRSAEGSTTTTTRPSSTTEREQTSTTVPTSTTTAPDPVEQDVLAAYQGYWRAWLVANDPPDMFNALLKEYATGDAYDRAFEAIQANRLAERALRLPEGARYGHVAEVVRIDGDQATVRDCNIDDAVLVDLNSGEVINDEVATKLFEATMVLVEGDWKLADSVRTQRWEGVAGCAVE